MDRPSQSSANGVDRDALPARSTPDVAMKTPNRPARHGCAGSAIGCEGPDVPVGRGEREEVGLNSSRLLYG